MDTHLSQAQKERTQYLGSDLKAVYRIRDGRYEDVDVDTVQVVRRGKRHADLALASGVDNIIQAVIHRLKTCYGELAPLGHPDYGSRHNDLIGEPNTEHNRRLVKLYILQALAREPRIEKIFRADIRYDRRLDPSRVDIVLDIKLGMIQETINLVVPFYFEVGA
jgi:phage baseplate assembly protein W